MLLGKIEFDPFLSLFYFSLSFTFYVIDSVILKSIDWYHGLIDIIKHGRNIISVNNISYMYHV